MDINIDILYLHMCLCIYSTFKIHPEIPSVVTALSEALQRSFGERRRCLGHHWHHPVTWSRLATDRKVQAFEGLVWFQNGWFNGALMMFQWWFFMVAWWWFMMVSWCFDDGLMMFHDGFMVVWWWFNGDLLGFTVLVVYWKWPSRKRLHNYRKSPFFVGKSTNYFYNYFYGACSIAILAYLSLPEGTRW